VRNPDRRRIATEVLIVTKHGRALLVAALLVGGTAWAAVLEPPEPLIGGDGPQHGAKVSAPTIDSEPGPIDLPKPKRPPEKIPAPLAGSMDSGSFGLPAAIGGGALPGGSGSAGGDPVSQTERELKRLIRRLDD
jgi:hypothetical protein